MTISKDQKVSARFNVISCGNKRPILISVSFSLEYLFIQHNQRERFTTTAYPQGDMKGISESRDGVSSECEVAVNMHLYRWNILYFIEIEIAWWDNRPDVRTLKIELREWDEVVSCRCMRVRIAVVRCRFADARIGYVRTTSQSVNFLHLSVSRSFSRNGNVPNLKIRAPQAPRFGAGRHATTRAIPRAAEVAERESTVKEE